jgi:hypothetical protein
MMERKVRPPFIGSTSFLCIIFVVRMIKLMKSYLYPTTAV